MDMPHGPATHPASPLITYTRAWDARTFVVRAFSLSSAEREQLQPILDQLATLGTIVFGRADTLAEDAADMAGVVASLSRSLGALVVDAVVGAADSTVTRFVPLQAVVPLWEFEPAEDTADVLVADGLLFGQFLMVEALRVEDDDEPVPRHRAVLIGARDFSKDEAAANDIGERAITVQIDVTDEQSIAAAAERIRSEFGRLDLLVNNAAISMVQRNDVPLQDYASVYGTSVISPDKVRAIWETNVFGQLAVYQAMLPLLRLSSDARIVNVGSCAGSPALNADPAFLHRKMFGPGYAGSKTAFHIMALSMMIEHEGDGIKVNLVSPAFTSTALNGLQGTSSLDEGTREVVRVAKLGPDGPSGTFTNWEAEDLPW